MARPEPAWVDCFCSHWEQEVVYSTSGPWWSERFLDQMLELLAEQESRAAASKSASQSAGGRGSGSGAAAASPGGSAAAEGSEGSASPRASDRRGRGRLAEILSRPMPLSPVAAAALAKAGGGGGGGAGRKRAVPAYPPGSQPFRALSDHDFTASWQWFMGHTSEARAALVHLLLEQVPPDEVPRLLPSNVTGSDAGERWFRLRQAVDWEACPGLDWWLHSHHDRLGVDLGLDFKDVNELIAAGGDTGVLGLARPPARLPSGAKHPLAAEAHGLCTFYRDRKSVV